MNAITPVNQVLLDKFKRMFRCDAARISQPLPNDTMFLIIGRKRHTSEDAGIWIDQQGSEKNWDYLAESCIASGDTEEELMASARKYHDLQGLSMLDVFEGKTKKARAAAQHLAFRCVSSK
jgi:hypothetical protein